MVINRADRHTGATHDAFIGEARHMWGDIIGNSGAVEIGNVDHGGHGNRARMQRSQPMHMSISKRTSSSLRGRKFVRCSIPTTRLLAFCLFDGCMCILAPSKLDRAAIKAPAPTGHGGPRGVVPR